VDTDLPTTNSNNISWVFKKASELGTEFEVRVSDF
jgi:hypothetical protein